jgi:hypothetical protein
MVGRLLADVPAELHKACATHSATGATARPQVGAVLASVSVSDAINLAFPLRCSKNHSLLRGCVVIQSSKYAST